MFEAKVGITVMFWICENRRCSLYAARFKGLEISLRYVEEG